MSRRRFAKFDDRVGGVLGGWPEATILGITACLAGWFTGMSVLWWPYTPIVGVVCLYVNHLVLERLLSIDKCNSPCPECGKRVLYRRIEPYEQNWTMSGRPEGRDGLAARCLSCGWSAHGTRAIPTKEDAP